MSVSLSTAEEQAFESVAGPPVNEAAADRDAEREDYDDDIYGDEDGDLAPARYMVGLLTTPEERETAKALRVAKDLRKSAQIVNKYNGERNELRRQLDDDNERKYKAKELHKKEMLLRWSKKLDKSSFLVDLVAESERIDEEQRVKIEEEARRAKVFEERKQKIKTEIILKALAESNDLEQLRQEKRLIQDEERRLKVQQGQEKKGQVGKKEDLMRATQEERRRRNEQQMMQQRNRLALQQAEEAKRREALLMKMQMKYGEVPGEPRLITPAVTR
eukprot:CAMPEP_0180136998 /NCGR_PEP_ID=MMETSP0986-20121125/11898_1 /TAXON_ID=697907 /ORGANISM="non described non described, Strain CCMP2293" /LENGTH=274 /DNA_ID=CAMNT_0022078271 /DNA_START=146 /DNA_END=970 /DNA_ORIENTATION=+